MELAAAAAPPALPPPPPEGAARAPSAPACPLRRAGGNSGIGVETVRALAHAGADCVLCSRSVEAGQKVADELQPGVKVGSVVAAFGCGARCWQWRLGDWDGAQVGGQNWGDEQLGGSRQHTRFKCLS